mmetsp:Transcript_19234/g.35286  ORF Transcript_19234/g.35286 Transcript_19234/m.35286 type:complete len:303 (-) Transcript_19234:5316-6224(-)
MEAKLQTPFVFWNKKGLAPSHSIQLVAAHGNCLVSADERGDLCFWSKGPTGYQPYVLASLQMESPCRALCFINAPLDALLQSEMLAVSYHADHRLRAWNTADGRCVSLSSMSLMPQEQFQHMTAIQGRCVAVWGKNSSIQIIDIWTMTSLCQLLQSCTLQACCVIKGQLWALETDFQLTLWALPDYSNHMIDSEVPPPPPTLEFSYNLPAQTTDFGIYDDLVALLAGDRVLLISLGDLMTLGKEYYELPEQVEAMWLYSHGLYLKTAKRAVTKYPVKELQAHTGGTKIRRKSFNLSEAEEAA